MRWQVSQIFLVLATSKSAGRFIHITYIYKHSFILETQKGRLKAYLRCAGDDFTNFISIGDAQAKFVEIP